MSTKTAPMCCLALMACPFPDVQMDTIVCPIILYAHICTGKSLDAIIEENRSKASGMGGRGRGGRGTGRAPARSGAGGSAASGEGKSRGGGGRRTGSRVTSRLSGIAGLPQARRGGAGKQQAVVVGGTRYVKAQVPGVSSGGVTKAGGRKVRCFLCMQLRECLMVLCLSMALKMHHVCIAIL